MQVFEGVEQPGQVWRNLNTPALYEHAVRRYEGMIAHLGPLVVRTGQYTGRSPNDKWVVDEPGSRDDVWWGNVNRAMSPDSYEHLRARLMAYLQQRELFVQDCYSGADERHRLAARLVTEHAWQSLFVRNMFIQEHDPEALETFAPEFTLVAAPGFHAVPEIDGTRTEVFVAVHLGRKEVIIGGTEYAGEIKKAMFSVMNYLLPKQGILAMHASANHARGKPDDCAIFFGLSGTGKTTLSADPNRVLIGDDEHGWGDNGVFNFEGGCYAKVIKLSPTGEPEIYDTTRRFGTILENVAIDPDTRDIDLDSDAYTENTRASYPLSHIPNASTTSMGGHAKVVIMLTADAFGVLPPIAQLTPEQAMYHFISGYTAKVAGTERGVTEPQATFSACFGAPFMMHPPAVYAELLAKKIREHGSKTYLINTGWTGGPYGVGERMHLAHTRAMVDAALNDAFDGVEFREDPFFGVMVPTKVAGVPDEVLDPRSSWADPSAYDDQAAELAAMFVANFAEFEDTTSDEVRAAGPRITTTSTVSAGSS
ncbi:MAG TPA: phosphoenolpyruvate carboxykinase (ATP) [Ilumatobacteraceae bacterium]|nr:phosphoenolpyruvate carboxykinase (ATP) [Ilumatobacteraceae bacterium]